MWDFNKMFLFTIMMMQRIQLLPFFCSNEDATIILQLKYEEKHFVKKDLPYVKTSLPKFLTIHTFPEPDFSLLTFNRTS